MRTVSSDRIRNIHMRNILFVVSPLHICYSFTVDILVHIIIADCTQHPEWSVVFSDNCLSKNMYSITAVFNIWLLTSKLYRQFVSKVPLWNDYVHTDVFSQQTYGQLLFSELWAIKPVWNAANQTIYLTRLFVKLQLFQSIWNQNNENHYCAGHNCHWTDFK